MMDIPLIKPCEIRLAGILRRIMFLFIVLYTKEGNMCISNVCLTWRVSQNELTLICKINKMYLRVFFDDPYGNTQADCLPPYKHNCEAYYQNGSVYFNSTTKEAIFTTKGTIDHRLNGKWSCRYGTSRDRSEVNILVRHTEDINVLSFTFDKPATTVTRQSKMETTTQFDMLTDAKNYTNHNITTENGMKTVLSHLAYYGPLTAGIAFVLIGVVVCNIRISHHRRRVKLIVNTETVIESRILSRAPASSNSVETTDVYHSGYETINENEMLSYPALMSRLDEESVNRRTPLVEQETNTDCKFSSSTTYIDVIDDSMYLNPYQSVIEPRDPNDMHMYTCIAGRYILKRRFTFPTSPGRGRSFSPELLFKTVPKPTFEQFDMKPTIQAKQSVMRCNGNSNIENPRFHSSNSLNKNNYFHLKELYLSSYPHRCPMYISKSKNQQENTDDLPDFSDVYNPRNVMSTLL